MNEYGEVINNASLKNYNTYRIDTYAKYLIKPYNINCLKELIKYLNKENIKYYVLGKGSNVILPDNTFNGVIITLENLNKLNIENTEVYAEAGVILNNLVIKTIECNLKGLESLANIPGTIGGALYGNAGAMGRNIYDVVKDVTILKDNEIVTLSLRDIEYSYRDTSFKRSKDIILSCHLNLEKGNKNELLKIISENKEKRRQSQPLDLPNAGSVFKNPEGVSAGKLIDDLGLKGYHVNDAYISDVHANFIVNKGKASSEDIKKLISIIKEKVYNEYNISLELEQIIVEWD